MSKKTVFIVVIVIFIISIIASYSAFTFIPQSKEAKNIEDKFDTRRDAINRDIFDVDEEETSGLQGIVRELEASIYLQGTHYLEAGGITLTLLKSDDVNLDKYVGKEVKIWGDTTPTVEGDGVITDVYKIEKVD